MMGDAGWRKGLQTPPHTILGWWFNYRNRGGPCWRVYVTCCQCRRGGGAQGNARPQAGLAGIQPRWHRSDADRRAEPPPQMLSCCRRLPAGHWCASHPPQAALPCFAFALPLPCITAASSLPRAEPGGMPRLETRTQRGPFQKENCKAGVRSVALSTYTCA